MFLADENPSKRAAAVIISYWPCLAIPRTWPRFGVTVSCRLVSTYLVGRRAVSAAKVARGAPFARKTCVNDNLWAKCSYVGRRRIGDPPLLSSQRCVAGKISHEYGRSYFLGVQMHCAQCHDDPERPNGHNATLGISSILSRKSRPAGSATAHDGNVVSAVDANEGEVRLPNRPKSCRRRFPGGDVVTDEARHVASIGVRPLANIAGRTNTSPAPPSIGPGPTSCKGIVDSLDDVNSNHRSGQSLVELADDSITESGYDLEFMANLGKHAQLTNFQVAIETIRTADGTFCGCLPSRLCRSNLR